MKNIKTDFAYLAGLIDGEGTLTLKYSPKKGKRSKQRKWYLYPAISISNTNVEMIDFCVQKFNMKKARYMSKKMVAKGYSVGWRAIEEGIKNPMYILEGVLPYLTCKKSHCLLLLEFIKEHRRTQELTTRQLQIFWEIKHLNFSFPGEFEKYLKLIKDKPHYKILLQHLETTSLKDL